MHLYRDPITAPGVCDNDWAHAPYDDMRFARGVRSLGNREPRSALRGVEVDDDPALSGDEVIERAGESAPQR